MYCGQRLLQGLDCLLSCHRDLLHGIGQPDIVGQFGIRLDELAIGLVSRLHVVFRRPLRCDRCADILHGPVKFLPACHFLLAMVENAFHFIEHFAWPVRFGDIRLQHVDDRSQAIDGILVGMVLRLLGQAFADLRQGNAEPLHDAGTGVLLGQGLHLCSGNFEGRRPVARSSRFLLGQSKFRKASQQADVGGVGHAGVVLEKLIAGADDPVVVLDGPAFFFRHRRNVNPLPKFARTGRREEPKRGQ